MIKQLITSIIAKYRDLSESRRSRYFAQPRPIIVKYSPYKVINFSVKLFFSLFSLKAGAQLRSIKAQMSWMELQMRSMSKVDGIVSKSS